MCIRLGAVWWAPPKHQKSKLKQQPQFSGTYGQEFFFYNELKTFFSDRHCLCSSRLSSDLWPSHLGFQSEVLGLQAHTMLNYKCFWLISSLLMELKQIVSYYSLCMWNALIFPPMILLLNACCNLNNFFLKISQVILPVEDRCPGIWRENALSWHSFAA